MSILKISGISSVVERPPLSFTEFQTYMRKIFDCHIIDDTLQLKIDSYIHAYARNLVVAGLLDRSLEADLTIFLKNITKVEI